MSLNSEMWWEKVITTVIVVAIGVTAWFWKFVMGHNKRLSAVEKDLEITNERLKSIQDNIERGVNAIEKMDERHRSDIVRAYEKVEAVHVLIYEVLKGQK